MQSIITQIWFTYTTDISESLNHQFLPYSVHEQRRSQDPRKHLRWRVLQQKLTAKSR